MECLELRREAELSMAIVDRFGIIGADRRPAQVNCAKVVRQIIATRGRVIIEFSLRSKAKLSNLVSRGLTKAS